MENNNETLTTKEHSKIAEARGKIYGFLGFIYLQKPTSDFFKNVIFNEEFYSSVSKLNIEDAEIKDGLKILENFLLGSKKKSLEELTDVLAAEYARLFRGIKRDYSPPPPYESVYRGEGFVMGELATQVAKKYAEVGVKLADEYGNEPPDYIGLELHFMNFLCNKEANSWKSGKDDEVLKFLKLEEKFLREHLITWVPNFCDVVIDQDKSGFYKSIAKITKAFILHDIKYISTLLLL